MSIYTIPNITSGIDDALVGTIEQVPAFTPLLLLFIFLIVMMGGSIAQKLREGSADMPMWSTLASVVCLLASLIMSLRSGLIQLEIISIVIVITCLSGVWLFLSRNRNEV